MNQKPPIAPVSSPVSSPVFSIKAFQESLSNSPLTQLTGNPPVKKQTPRNALAQLTNHPQKNPPVSNKLIYRHSGTLVIKTNQVPASHSNPSKKGPT